MSDPRDTLRSSSRSIGNKAEGASAAGRLTAVYPPELLLDIGLDEETLTIGRDGTGAAYRRLPHATVSRQHARIAWDAAAERHTLTDLGSQNQSYVGGKLARDAVPLEDGAVVALGDVLLVYERFGAPLPEEVPGAESGAIFGRALALVRARFEVTRAAADLAPALIVGETGVGKEFVARELHRLSGRSGPFLAINCANLTAELTESQLFGHVAGAFTGAAREQPGMFRAAQGGTLLLDEVGELPLALQPKLLRVIEERSLTPVGGTTMLPIDVRVVAATHRDLAEEVENDTFRRDLYARVSLWEIRVPPLRRRRVDILAWLARLHQRWLEERGAHAGKPLLLDVEAAETLLLHSWPDNLRGIDRCVRELGELAARGVTIKRAQLPEWVRGPLGGRKRAAVEEPAPRDKPRPPSRDELLLAIERAAGSVRAIAKHFARDRRQIYRWLDKHGLRDRVEAERDED